MVIVEVEVEIQVIILLLSPQITKIAAIKTRTRQTTQTAIIRTTPGITLQERLNYPV
jgi:hypothetical protein